jgi:hypothetical protein
VILDVERCLNDVFWVGRGHGKSPCFLGVAFLRLVSPDCTVLKLFGVDGGVCFV